VSEPRAVDVLLSAEQIRQRVAAIAAEVRRDHQDGIHLVAVLNGAFVFLADLVRHLDGPVSLDFVTLSSYTDRTSTSGEVRLLNDLNQSIEGRDVVIVEDIVDSGLTLATLGEILRRRSPRTLRTACLLNKPSRRLVDVALDYVGFTIGDHFVVGYGLDHADRYRNLPYIGVLR
jgi:hypoxanthine phosphoribosyltransferase